MPSTPPFNRELVLPFALPYLCYVGALMFEEWIGRAAAYGLAGSAAAAACIAVRSSLRPLGGPRSRIGSIAWGALAGLLGCGLWVALLSPFASEQASPWSPLEAALRSCAASLVVPIFEEQLMRGYVLGLAVQWQRAREARAVEPLTHALDRESVLTLEPGACTWLAAAISTLVFSAGHAMIEWPAALAYGAGMAALYAWRKDLLSCIVAHAVTNATLAGLVIGTGSWRLW